MLIWGYRQQSVDLVQYKDFQPVRPVNIYVCHYTTRSLILPLYVWGIQGPHRMQHLNDMF